MRLLGILLASLFMIAPTLAQDGNLNTGMRPSNSPEPVLSAEIWDRLDLEYFTIQVAVTQLTVDAQAAMSALAPALAELDQCIGTVPAQPTFTIQWDRAELDEVLPVAFYTFGNHDATMIVREPDGDWHCSDNFDNTSQPYISIDTLRSGAYEIWIGSETGIDDFTSSLYVTIGEDTPDNAPRPCCDGLAFPNPAQGATEATITYFEVDPLDETDRDADGIKLSTDIIFRGEGGTTFTIEAFAFDSATDETIALAPSINPGRECEASTQPCDVERIRRGASRRDYGSRGGPVNFDISELNVAGLGEDYYLEVVVTAYAEDADPEMVDSIRIESPLADAP